MNYRREIDGLRSVAVIPVILFHGGMEVFSGGYVGVDVFFVISGYLITGIIIGEMAEGRFSVLRFYERRARRILPALLLVMLCCLPFAWAWMLPTQARDFAESLIAVTLFASNFLFWSEAGYFETTAELKPLLHTWSLAVEEQYYMLFPLFLMLVWRLGWRRVFFLVCGIALVSLALTEPGWRYRPEGNFFLAPTRAWELLGGSICAFLQQAGGQRRNGVLAAVGLALIVFGIFAFDSATPFPSYYALAPVGGTMLIVLYGAEGTWVARLLSMRIPVAIGLISYSAYLWHQPLFAFARLRSVEEPPVLLMAGLAAASLALAWLSWRFVERPFRARPLPVLPSRAAVFGASGAGGAVFIAIGLSGYVTDGALFRYSPQDRPLAALDVLGEGEHSARHFDAMQLAPFPANGKRNVLIIGDSYAGDFANVLVANGRQDSVNLSGFHISRRCGNLLVDDDLSQYIVDKERCAVADGYDSDDLRALLRQADAVILVSSWQVWQAPLVKESVANIQALTPAKILVLGRKSFGPIRPRALLEIPFEERMKLRQAPADFHVETNEIMVAANIPGFINLDFLLCGERRECRIFDDEGALLTFDGLHLSSAGARYVGKLLMDSSPELREVFAPPHPGS